MTVVTQKLLPSAKIVAKKKTIPVSTLKSVEIENSTETSSLKEKLILIKNFLGEKYERGLTSWRMKRRQRQEEKRKLREEKIEKKKETKVTLPKVSNPFSNIFKSISNFLLFLGGGILLNAFLDLQDLFIVLEEKILPAIKTGILIFAGVISNTTDFIDSAYAGYDKFKKQILDITGVKEEDVEKFSGLLNKVINGTIIAAMITLRALPGILSRRGLNSGRGGGSPRITRGRGTPRPFLDRFRSNRRISSPSLATTKSLPRGGRPKVTGFTPGKFGRSAVTNFSRKTLVRTLGKPATKTLLKFTKKFITPAVSKIPLIGGLIDFALNYFVFGDPAGQAAFKAIGAGLGLWIGGLLGSIPVLLPWGPWVGSMIGSTAGDALGGLIYDSLFGDKTLDLSSDLNENASYDLISDITTNIIQPIEV